MACSDIVDRDKGDHQPAPCGFMADDVRPWDYMAPGTMFSMAPSGIPVAFRVLH